MSFIPGEVLAEKFKAERAVVKAAEQLVDCPEQDRPQLMQALEARVAEFRVARKRMEQR